MRFLNACIVTLLLTAVPAAQDDEQKPPAFGGGWNPDIGLGGGAGGIYALRGRGLSALRHRDAETAERLDALEARIAARPSWAERETGPTPTEIEDAAWSLLELSVHSTLRSGPRKDAARAAVADLSSVPGLGEVPVLPESGERDVRLQALASWALAEAATVSQYRLMRERCTQMSAALAVDQLEDGSLPARSGSKTGDAVVTSLALHAWRAADDLQPAGPEIVAAAERARTWLRERAGVDGEAAVDGDPIDEADGAAARLLYLEQLLLDLDRDRDADDDSLWNGLPEIDDERWTEWATRPELRLAWLTVARAGRGALWDAAWERARRDARALDPDAASAREVAVVALELSAPHRYAVLRGR